MLRVWLFSALGVAVVVMAVLLFGGSRKEGPATEDASAKPPAPLQSREIELYLEVWPKVDQKLGEVAQATKLRWQKEGRFPAGTDPQAQARYRDIIEALLERHHLSLQSFQTLRSRIWYAVEVVRWENEAKRRNDDLELRIKDKQQLLELAGKAELRKRILADIEALRKQRLAKGPPLLDADRRLVKSYWKALAPLVPEFAGKPKPD